MKISVNEAATGQNDDVSLEKDITAAPIQENTIIPALFTIPSI
jgi:hypothetical protein